MTSIENQQEEGMKVNKKEFIQKGTIQQSIRVFEAQSFSATDRKIEQHEYNSSKQKVPKQIQFKH